MSSAELGAASEPSVSYSDCRRFDISDQVGIDRVGDPRSDDRAGMKDCRVVAVELRADKDTCVPAEFDSKETNDLPRADEGPLPRRAFDVVHRDTGCPFGSDDQFLKCRSCRVGHGGIPCLSGERVTQKTGVDGVDNVGVQKPSLACESGVGKPRRTCDYVKSRLTVLGPAGAASGVAGKCEAGVLPMRC